MSYRMIALDLDGTLLTARKQILPESLVALEQARNAGLEVLIATGRHHVAIHPFYQSLNLSSPAICCNGAYLYDYPQRKVLAADPLALTQAHQILERLASNDIHGLLYVDDAMLYQHSSRHIIHSHTWAASLPENQRPNLLQVPSLVQAAEQACAIWKFAMSDENIAKLHACVTEIEETLGLACEWSWHDQVDISQTGNSKGKRLREYAASRGIDMSEIVAFGDNFNDISMLESVGLGVAMGNSDDAVKARAAAVIGNNEMPSIANFLQHHVL